MRGEVHDAIATQIGVLEECRAGVATETNVGGGRVPSDQARLTCRALQAFQRAGRPRRSEESGRRGVGRVARRGRNGRVAEREQASGARGRGARSGPQGQQRRGGWRAA
jgi:hypothetical protein